ncbi:hypothetical protein [Streptomyces sp. ODS28]|uniref:hypothetical protein n=1 Tax=Streptomyces sp. ODS28 TaxID=3136688 RepID=UPI0031E91616
MSADHEEARSALLQQNQWLTVRGCKRVLVLVHTLTYAQRLRDAFALLEPDLRIQVLFTAAPHAFGRGVARHLQDLGAAAVPWDLALRTPFDLALSAGSRGIERLRAPLVRLAHGAGHNKPLRAPDAGAPAPSRVPRMLSRENLVHGDRPVPAAIALSHRRDLEALARTCPEALHAATVVGDPCHDRLVANLPRREEFRRALGIRPGQRLVMVTSTWGPTGSLGGFGTLLPQVLGELPPEYRIVVSLHPNVWAGHGERQIRGWLAAGGRGRLALLPPGADWQAPLIAADHVIGDHGSVTAYSTLTGVPLLLTHCADRATVPDSLADRLAACAPALSPMHPLADQLRYAAEEHRPERYAPVARLLSSAPGCFHRHMRTLMYRLLRLGEPAYPASAPPVPVPPPLDDFEIHSAEVRR